MNHLKLTEHHIPIGSGQVGLTMMSEGTMPDSLCADGFHSCEGFADWSICSPVHWNEDQGDSSGFGDWSSFHSSFSEDVESSHLPTPERSSDDNHKVFFSVYVTTIVWNLFGCYFLRVQSVIFFSAGCFVETDKSFLKSSEYIRSLGGDS